VNTHWVSHPTLKSGFSSAWWSRSLSLSIFLVAFLFLLAIFLESPKQVQREIVETYSATAKDGKRNPEKSEFTYSQLTVMKLVQRPIFQLSFY
jgi:hypothetical protein